VGLLFVNNQIIRIESCNAGSANGIRIWGLNLFSLNCASDNPRLDPRLQLLDYITGRTQEWSALIGAWSLLDNVDTLEELVQDKGALFGT